MSLSWKSIIIDYYKEILKDYFNSKRTFNTKIGNSGNNYIKQGPIFQV